MNNVRVKGFKDVTFWQDSGIGVIVLRSDEKGMMNWNVLNELIASIGTASMDEHVNAVAITGLNENFGTGLKAESDDINTARDILDSANSLVSLVYSLEIPIFSILSGDAIDYGYEIALLSDVIISHRSNKVGFSKGYRFAIGGSVTSARFRNNFEIQPVAEGGNVDILLEKDTLLEDAKKYILEHRGYSYHLLRRRMMRGLRESLLEERENFMRRYIRTTG